MGFFCVLEISMFKIQGIDHIVLRTNHIDNMIAFYCDFLGCSIENQQKEIRLTQVRAGNNLIDLVEVDQPIDKNNRNVEHFCLRVQPFDFEFLKKYCEDHKISVARYGERYGAQGKVHSFYIKDPEDNEIELCETKT